MATKVGFKVDGIFLEKDGYVLARSTDGRFVTRGKDKVEALKKMNSLLAGYQGLAKKYGFDPTIGPQPQPGPIVEKWELVPAV